MFLYPHRKFSSHACITFGCKYVHDSVQIEHCSAILHGFVVTMQYDLQLHESLHSYFFFFLLFSIDLCLYNMFKLVLVLCSIISAIYV